MPRKAPSPTRLDTSVTDRPTIEQAHQLMAQLEIGNADLYRSAVELLGWCVREVREGRRIASVDDRGEPVREVAMPVLTYARTRRRLTVAEEALEQVVHLVEHPPAPTPALRDLMARTRAMREEPPQASHRGG